jgi:hypothetical protein
LEIIMSSVTGATRIVVHHTTKQGEKRVYRYWRARIMINGRPRALGNFKSREDAMAAYRAACLSYRAK